LSGKNREKNLVATITLFQAMQTVSDVFSSIVPGEVQEKTDETVQKYKTGLPFSMNMVNLIQTGTFNIQGKAGIRNETLTGLTIPNTERHSRIEGTVHFMALGLTSWDKQVLQEFITHIRKFQPSKGGKMIAELKFNKEPWKNPYKVDEEPPDYR
jgi:hypothetical protein